EVLQREELRWRTHETWFGKRVDPDFAEKRGAIERLYTEPPAGSVVICLDEMGPALAKFFADQRLVDATKRPAERAKQEIDYGRRGKGYLFGAFQPATGEAFTGDYAGRTIANWVDFLEQVEQQLAPEIERVYAIFSTTSIRITPTMCCSSACGIR